jgi:hypothetical protein
LTLEGRGGVRGFAGRFGVKLFQIGPRFKPEEQDLQRISQRMTERFLRQRQAAAPNAESGEFCSEAPVTHPAIESLGGST